MRLLENYLENDEIRCKIGLSNIHIRFLAEVPENYIAETPIKLFSGILCALKRRTVSLRKLSFFLFYFPDCIFNHLSYGKLVCPYNNVITVVDGD